MLEILPSSKRISQIPVTRPRSLWGQIFKNGGITAGFHFRFHLDRVVNMPWLIGNFSKEEAEKWLRDVGLAVSGTNSIRYFLQVVK